MSKFLITAGLVILTSSLFLGLSLKTISKVPEADLDVEMN